MELYERFTDLDYKTPKGVRTALGMSSIDPFWVGIDKYRKANTQGLLLRTVGQASSYRYVATPALSKKYGDLGSKIEAFVKAYKELDSDTKAAVDKAFKKEALSRLNVIKRTKASELTLKAMVNKMYRDEEPAFASLKGYLEALEDMAYRGVRTLDEDFLAREFEFLCQTAELTSFYRQGATNEKSIRIQVGSLPEAYSEDIPLLMEGLMNFLAEDPTPIYLKAFIAMYALLAIRPFASYNEEMACLLCKAALSGHGEAATLLPVEVLLLPSESFSDYFATTLRTGDMTYVIQHTIKELNTAIDSSLDQITRFKKNALLEEFVVKTVEEPAPITPVEVKTEPVKIVEAPVKETPTVVPPRQEPRPEPKPEPRPEPRPTPTPTPEPRPVKRIEAIPVGEGERAVSAPRASLNDKEIKETAKYLRESHPGLSKGQCLFYASHCTLGRYYAIADYKKTMKCAYETARTSMDKLAAEGFYQKLQVKNKFVYTPIKQGENK